MTEWSLCPPGIQLPCLSVSADGSGRMAATPAEPLQADAMEFLLQHRAKGIRGQRERVSGPNLHNSRAH